MTKVANIAKNTSYFTFALILQKILSFTYFVLLANFLDPEQLGKYYFAISFTTIFAIFIDIGLANVLMREIPKNHNKANNILSSVLIVKLPLAFISFLSVLLLINLMGYPELTRNLVYFSSICMILDSFTLTLYSCIRGFHNLLFESIGSILFQLIVLTIGFYILKSGLGLIYLMTAVISASIFNFIFSLLITKLKLNIKISLKPDKLLIKSILIITIPFAVFAILQRMYMYFDAVLLSLLAGDKYVGLYQVSFKIIFALQFLPSAFIASVYPAFSSYWKNNRQQLFITFERSLNYLIIISLPISIGIIILADKILLIFKPEYIEALTSLRIIMISLIFIFINFLIGSLLNACDRQKNNTINMAITLISSIILNLILIPIYDVVGASITVVISNFIMFFLGMYWVPKIIKFNYLKVMQILVKAIIAVTVMSLLVFFTKSLFNIIIVIILGGLIYFIMLYLLGGIKKEDIVSIYYSLIKKKNIKI